MKLIQISQRRKSVTIMDSKMVSHINKKRNFLLKTNIRKDTKKLYNLKWKTARRSYTFHIN